MSRLPILSVLALTVAIGAQTTAVVPPYLANSDGNTASPAPFTPGSSFRFQQILDGREFATVGAC